jgi:hypothetical protein
MICRSYSHPLNPVINPNLVPSQQRRMVGIINEIAMLYLLNYSSSDWNAVIDNHGGFKICSIRHRKKYRYNFGRMKASQERSNPT